MLEKIIEIAASKAVEGLVTHVLSKAQTKQVQHTLVYKKSHTLRGIKDHLRVVKSWSQDIELMGMPRPRSLEDIYVRLSLTDDPRRLSLGELPNGGVSYSVDKALSLNHNLVILGDPGSGKTTTLKKIAHDSLGMRSVDETAHLPVVIRLRDLKPQTGLFKTLKELFCIKFVEKAYKLQGSEEVIEGFDLAEKRALATFLDEMKVILLLDGFDESHPDLRQPILEELEFLGPRLERSRIILTSRSADFERKPGNFLLFEIRPLSDKQVRLLVTLWFNSAQHRRTAEGFFAALESAPYTDLLSRPLTLANLCLIFEKYGSLPELPTSVYRKTINLLLEEWDAERGVIRRSRYSLFDPHRKMLFLAAFAYQLVTDKANTLSFRTDDLVGIYSKIHQRFGLPPEEAEATAKEIESHTGIIIRVSYDRYEFSHKSLQEFLVAEHLVRLRDIPSAILLLRTCPNELAISTALSSDPTDWLCGLFREKGKRIKPKSEWLVPFLHRLYLEQPCFEATPELGVTFLWLLSRCGELSVDRRLAGFLRMKSVGNSIKSYLGYCVVGDSPHSDSLVVVRQQRKIEAKYPVPTEIEIPKAILQHFTTA